VDGERIDEQLLFVFYMQRAIKSSFNLFTHANWNSKSYANHIDICCKLSFAKFINIQKTMVS
jgi:hypothetical protein